MESPPTRMRELRQGGGSLADARRTLGDRCQRYPTDGHAWRNRLAASYDAPDLTVVGRSIAGVHISPGRSHEYSGFPDRLPRFSSPCLLEGIHSWIRCGRHGLVLQSLFLWFPTSLTSVLDVDMGPHTGRGRPHRNLLRTKSHRDGHWVGHCFSISQTAVAALVLCLGGR
jgi:hypothetical protein